MQPIRNLTAGSKKLEQDLSERDWIIYSIINWLNNMADMFKRVLPLLETLEAGLEAGEVSLDVEFLLLDVPALGFFRSPLLLFLQGEVVRVLDVLNVLRKNGLRWQK